MDASFLTGGTPSDVEVPAGLPHSLGWRSRRFPQEPTDHAWRANFPFPSCGFARSAIRPGVSAGREVRIIVESKIIDDFTAIKLAKEIAHKIESTMSYPGTIKVNVLRETRAVEYAK